MSLKSEAVKGVKWTTVSSTIIILIQFVQMLILSRILTPQDFGIIAIITIIINFLRFFSDFGVTSAVIQKDVVTQNQISSLFWLNIVIGILIFIIIFYSVPIVQYFYKQEIFSYLLKIVAFFFFFISLGSLFQSLLQKELLFSSLAKIEISSVVIGSAITIFLAIKGYGVWSIIFGQLANHFIRNFFLLIIGFKKYPIKFHFAKKDLEGFVSFGMFQMGERIINFISERIDQLLIGYVLGIEKLGYYNFAFNLANQPIAFVNPIINRVAFPVFSKVKNDEESLKKGFLTVIKTVMIINAPILIGLIIISTTVIPAVFGVKWIPSIEIFQILCLVFLFRCFGNPVGNLILSKGRADISFYWNVILFVLSIPVIYFGAKFYGLIGVALFLLLLQLILQVPSFLIQIKPFIGNCWKEYSLSFLIPVLVSVAMGLVVYLIQIPGINYFILLTLQIITGILSFLLFYFIVNKKDLLLLIQFIKSK